MTATSTSLPAPRTNRSEPRVLSGLALTGALAAGGIALAGNRWFQDRGFSALTITIVLGILLGNTVYPRVASICAAGIDFSKQTLLRAGVVLYGLRLTVQDIGHVGFAGIFIDALIVSSTFLLAVVAGTRWLGLDRKTAMLIGAGSAICGAAAVMATEPVVRGRTEQVTIAVATVVVLGTVAIFLYPVLFHLNMHWNLIPGGTGAFGVYAGSTIHEVAQVVAAARAISPDAANTAVIAKMVRVMMLAPFLMTLSAWLAREPRHSGDDHAMPSTKSRLVVPWFAFGFVAVVLLNSLHWMHPQIVGAAVSLDTVLLAMAMAALGLTTHAGAIRQAGLKPLLLALLLALWLIAGGALINRWLPMLIAHP